MELKTLICDVCHSANGVVRVLVESVDPDGNDVEGVKDRTADLCAKHRKRLNKFIARGCNPPKHYDEPLPGPDSEQKTLIDIDEEQS